MAKNNAIRGDRTGSLYVIALEWKIKVPSRGIKDGKNNTHIYALDTAMINIHSRQAIINCKPGVCVVCCVLPWHLSALSAQRHYEFTQCPSWFFVLERCNFFLCTVWMYQAYEVIFQVLRLYLVCIYYALLCTWYKIIAIYAVTIAMSYCENKAMTCCCHVTP